MTNTMTHEDLARHLSLASMHPDDIRVLAELQRAQDQAEAAR